ncbi:MAG: bifunctional pyr operon transcriptional regulator/uracil phosphoribosyltransferase PyrR [Akkermansia sp.]|nr:bifunctional pyr operon transcriptional regulator/uracil phosphoribosyltransferase PyrR [Akkermansia sp.]
MPTISKDAIQSALRDWAERIVASTTATEKLAVVGLISHGDILAQRLVSLLQEAGVQALYGALDISLYRDDFDMLSHKPALRASYLPFSTDGMRVILVDDVIDTGRTVRAALNALFEYGRPARVQLYALVDRGGRELPIHPDAAAFATPVEACVKVHLQEIDGKEDITY